ncbi:MAG TPA: hypothetical protein PKJ51_07375 [Methanothrix sp.]|nr:hypothetical protein [Methanothrix sp.]
MDPMDRTEWLDGLKPGDEVAFQLSPNAEVLIDQVRKRTPTGQIVLGCGRRFTAEGRGIVGGVWGKPNLMQVTPELKERVTAAKRRAAIKTLNWDQLSAGTIDEVYSLLSSLGELPGKAR